MKGRIFRAVLGALILVMAFAPLTAQAAEGKYLAMTFDDGPSGRFTRRLLEELEGRQSRVTFFLCGYRLEQYPDMAGRMLEAGHEIGLHGYSHACMENMSPEKLEWELSKTESLLREQTGTTSYLLRPPGGQTNQAVIHAAESHGLTLITWSVDPKDWATSNREKVVRSVVDHARDGDVILLHDMSDSSVDAALEIIDRLEAAGYQFVTVSELARLRGKTMEAGCLYTNFRPAFEVDAN